ncbi:hypothetical protein ABBQ32_007964 [Trebouxia sp. C0010 RCD-2024]
MAIQLESNPKGYHKGKKVMDTYFQRVALLGKNLRLDSGQHLMQTCQQHEGLMALCSSTWEACQEADLRLGEPPRRYSTVTSVSAEGCCQPGQGCSWRPHMRINQGGSHCTWRRRRGTTQAIRRDKQEVKEEQRQQRQPEEDGASHEA